MVRRLPVRSLLAGGVLLVAGASAAAAAMSVRDFLRPEAAAGGGGSASLTIEEFLRLGEAKEEEPGLARYFDGFRDALYQFNAVLQGVGVQVFCPAPGEPPIATAELRRRLEVDLAEKRSREPSFETYARNTSLGLVALEVLAALHPCEDEEGQGDGPAE